jgi:hypothetical protein
MIVRQQQMAKGDDYPILSFGELVWHIVSALMLGIPIDLLMTSLRKRKVDDWIQNSSWATRAIRQRVLYGLTAISQLMLIVASLMTYSRLFPQMAANWQITLAGMYFVALFFSLQTNLFTCILGSVYAD